jgi:hypothetical protein
VAGGRRVKTEEGEPEVMDVEPGSAAGSAAAGGAPSPRERELAKKLRALADLDPSEWVEQETLRYQEELENPEDPRILN